MEIFFRAQSKKYFEKMKCAIGFDDVQRIKIFYRRILYRKKGDSKVAALFFQS